MSKKTGIAIKLDKAKLFQLEREVPGRAGQVVQTIAQMAEGYAKDHMSPQSPSPEGGFPGVDIGMLKNSIVAEPDDSLPNTWILHDGVTYGAHLEYGTSKMPARPFMLPSIEWTAANIPDELLEAVVK